MLLILWKILIFFFVLGVLIFVHELGHFLVAKWAGVGVLKFSIGFGPALIRIKKGETEYLLRAIPFGGYVRMVGDMPDLITGPEETDDLVRDTDKTQQEEIDPENPLLFDKSRWFIEKSLFARSAIVFAGPLFNFLLAIVLIFFTVWSFGEDVFENRAVIGSVMEESPAEQAGLQVLDEVLEYNGEPILNWMALAKKIHSSGGKQVVLTVARGEERLDIPVEPRAKEMRNEMGKPLPVYLIGIGQRIQREPVGLLRALQVGILWTVDMTKRTYVGLWGMLSGEVSPKDLAGPIFIFDAASKQAERGIESLIGFMAILSVSLAVLNLLPIPVLDGGHLLFFFFEALFGPMSVRKKEIAQTFGMVLLLSLMVFAIHNDISRDPASISSEITWEDKTEE